MLEKPEFDCNNLGSFYDCGCAEGEDGEGGETQDKYKTPATARADAQDGGSDLHDHLVVEISKEASVSLLS